MLKEFDQIAAMMTTLQGNLRVVAEIFRGKFERASVNIYGKKRAGSPSRSGSWSGIDLVCATGGSAALRGGARPSSGGRLASRRGTAYQVP